MPCALIVVLVKPLGHLPLLFSRASTPAEFVHACSFGVLEVAA
jgi:hypothetical protein